MNEFPISVIVPLSKQREDFFYRFALPSIEANSPQEIIIVDEEGSAPFKRNQGFKLSKQNFIFFCDDDIILGADCLKKMFESIQNGPEAFAYSHYMGIVITPETHPLGHNFLHQAQPFNLNTLQKHNYIDTMSLMKREFFPGFDETLLGYQDWDLWLTITERGATGYFIDDMLYLKFYLDKGVSSNSQRHLEAKRIVKLKHNKDF